VVLIDVFGKKKKGKDYTNSRSAQGTAINAESYPINAGSGVFSGLGWKNGSKNRKKKRGKDG